jgi:hypothetical protein
MKGDAGGTHITWIAMVSLPLSRVGTSVSTVASIDLPAETVNRRTRCPFEANP